MTYIRIPDKHFIVEILYARILQMSIVKRNINFLQKIVKNTLLQHNFNWISQDQYENIH